MIRGDTIRHVGGRRTPEYTSWNSARTRCRNPKNSHWANYGGRGIEFDPRWDSFEAFLRDLGPRPAGSTLERDNVNGNYCPENCYWATHLEQGRNKRNTQLVEHQGQMFTLGELADMSGVDAELIRTRLKGGHWSVEDAITTPAFSKGNLSRIARESGVDWKKLHYYVNRRGLSVAEGIISARS